MASDFEIGGEFSLNKWGQGRPWGSPPPNGNRDDDPFGLGKSVLNKLDLWSVGKPVMGQQTGWPGLGTGFGVPMADWSAPAAKPVAAPVRIRPTAFEAALRAGGAGGPLSARPARPGAMGVGPAVERTPTGRIEQLLSLAVGSGPTAAHSSPAGRTWLTSGGHRVGLAGEAASSDSQHQASPTAQWLQHADTLRAWAETTAPFADALPSDVTPPSLLGSLVPIYGSGRMALYHLDQGHYGRAAGWFALMALDCLGVTKAVSCGLQYARATRLGVKAAVAEQVASSSLRNTASSLRHGLQHFTTEEAAASIGAGRLGGKYGIFALDRAAGYRPWRVVETLTWYRTPVGVRIPATARSAFAPPEVSGLFSASRRWWGTHVSPLGAVDLATGEFMEGVIFKNQVFREATVGEYARQLGHTWLLDYGVDALIMGWPKGWLLRRDAFSDDSISGLDSRTMF